MNTKEVGTRPDDMNYYDNQRLPGTVQPEPMRRDYAYGTAHANPAKPTNLDAKNTA